MAELPRPSYGDVARELDLLKAGVELALPQLERVRRYVKLGVGDRFEVELSIDRAIRDLTVGVS